MSKTLKITTVIEDTASGCDALKTTAQAVSSSTEATDFVVNSLDKKSWIIANADVAGFSINIRDLLEGSVFVGVNSIHIQLATYSENDAIAIQPRRCQLTWNANVLGKMSQFTLTNITSILDQDLLLDALEALTDEVLKLDVWIGIKK